MTHDALVSLAAKWLRRQGCSLILTEAKSRTDEIPDAIGFKESDSILVECKISRSDFLADAKKYFRAFPDMGMGRYRMYLCPAGIIQPEELPAKWGLLWVMDDGRIEKLAGPVGEVWTWNNQAWVFTELGIRAEHMLLLAALRRAQAENKKQIPPLRSE